MLQNPRSKNGLTLVELLVVMAVMLLLASLSLTAMKSLLRGQKVAQAAVTIKQYIQNAQIRALSSGRPVVVFLDRASVTGSGGLPTQQNYTVTRLQLGEVFHPYEGDASMATGQLQEFNYYDTGSGAPAWVASSGNYGTSRMLAAGGGVFNHDGRADQISIPMAAVASAFGPFFDSDNSSNTGFIKAGDFIEFKSPYDKYGRFLIERFKPDPSAPTRVVVQFFNPPPTYSLERRLKAANSRHLVYESIEYAANKTQDLPPTTSSDVGFRIYRQPTRSLVGSVVLPRGTCIDLSVSGVGISDNSVDGGSFRVKHTLANSVSPSNFSRIGFVFDPEGRLVYILDEDTTRATVRIAVDASSMIYLLVGRAEQVLPSFNGSNQVSAALQHPDTDVNPSGLSDLPKSNLLDPENIWVTINPFTGDVRTAPVAAIPSVNPNSTSVFGYVEGARSLASSGLSNRE